MECFLVSYINWFWGYFFLQLLYEGKKAIEKCIFIIDYICWDIKGRVFFLSQILQFQYPDILLNILLHLKNLSVLEYNLLDGEHHFSL